jgi:hypothetical protein
MSGYSCLFGDEVDFMCGNPFARFRYEENNLRFQTTLLR